MAQYTISEARNAGASAARLFAGGARDALRKAATVGGAFDIFLSHSFQDADLILGVRAILQRSGKRVYVDWIDDPQLDREQVSKSTAAQLRMRISQCSSLVYAATPAATSSKWMPWELGYFDGKKGLESVAVLPLVQYQGQSLGQEYLELYPIIERAAIPTGAPVVTQRRGAITVRKSLDDLVNGRGATAWRSY